jgi:hypothetical protein
MKYLAAMLLALSLFLVPTTADAQLFRHPPAVRVPSCKLQMHDGRSGWSTSDVKKLISCSVRRWPVAYGLGQALCVANRESNFYPKAANRTSSARGVFQVVEGTWNGWRARSARMFRIQHLNASRLNARSNVMTAIHEAHRSGWGPWGGRCG